MNVEGIRTYNMMKNFFENTDLNMNSWLINWGYMTGYLKNGQIQTNESYIEYQFVVIIILVLNVIRFIILLFSTKGSQTSSILGDWGYFLGPSVMINGIILAAFSYALMLMAFIKFCARNSQKMFYWLKIMDYDSETRCYPNMNLNELDSKIFIKRSLIFIIAFKCFTIVLMPLFLIVIFVSIFMNLDDYYLNRLIGFLIFFIASYHGIAYSIGLPVILYLVTSTYKND